MFERRQMDYDPREIAKECQRPNRGNAMTRRTIAGISSMIAVLFVSTAACAQGTVAIALPARAGAVDGKTENSDAFIWRLFTEFTEPVSKDSASPVVFETWASDDDTFSTTPRWPKAGEPLKLHASVLEVIKTLDTSAPLVKLHSETIDVKCSPPVGAAVGGFPTGGSPTPCIAEQVGRNRPQFDYIVPQKRSGSPFLRIFRTCAPPLPLRERIFVRGEIRAVMETDLESTRATSAVGAA
jgi:hypothetical protein